MKKFFLSSVLCLTLVACGGGGGGGGDNDGDNGNGKDILTKTIKGKVIDGYIVGATVFLDENLNGKLDNGEPYTLTENGGDYTLNLKGKYADCDQYAPIVTYVPVGAVDEALGEVEQAYYMSSPPKFNTVNENVIKHVTPLTSLIWSSMKGSYKLLSGKTCDVLKKHHDTYVRMQKLMQYKERSIASQYNIAIDELYSDFIKDDNAELKKRTEHIVRQLKAKYEYENVLKKTHPEADLVKVSFWESNYGLARKSEIFWKEGAVDYVKLINETVNRDDLTKVIALTFQNIKQSKLIKGMNFYTSTGWYMLTPKRAVCIIYERINDEPTRMENGTVTEIKNTVYFNVALNSGYDRCKDLTFTNEHTSREVSQYDRSDKLKENASQWNYPLHGYQFDDGLFMNMSDKVGREITTESFTKLPFRFVFGEGMDSNQAESYNSTRRIGAVDKAHTTDSWYSNGYQEKKVTSENGTYTVSCSKNGLVGTNESDCYDIYENQ